jgi:hypothetical protein
MTWLWRAKQVLADLVDLQALFTNNQAERDLRMVPRATQDRRNVSRVGKRQRLFVAIAVICPPCDCLGHTMLAALAAIFVLYSLPIAWGL